MPQDITAPEQFADMTFPLAGISLLWAFDDQRPVPMSTVQGVPTDYAHTTRLAVNVRGFEGATQRHRGGTRPGLAKYVPTPIVADWIVQELNLVTDTENAPVVQLSQVGRIVTLVAVSQGNVYTAAAGATSWTAAINSTGDTPPLIYTGVLYSTALNRKLWFADGTNWVYYDPSDNTVKRWAISKGIALPTDSQNNTPRLICTWRGRMVLSGLLKDPQNIFFSAVSDPTDFDYGPQDISPTQAASLNLSPMGLIGDVVTSLIPYSDDVLVVGTDHTIYMINGDPMAGGQIDLISDAIGVAWGVAWCKDPYGNLYFMSNKTGIYTLQPGQAPVRISQQIEQLLFDIDTGLNGIRLVWDDRYQGLHVFVTPLVTYGASTHFFFEQRTGAWWTDQFDNPKHSPLAACTFDGNLPGDRLAVLGSWDGYVRSFSPLASNDDGTPIASAVLIGPLTTKDLDELLLKDLQAVLGETSGPVSYAVYVGPTAEIATSRPAVAQGTWTAGRNLLSFVRASGHAVYVKITSTNRWSMETIRARIAGQGKVRRRGY